jgi:phosphohistidine phosphatase
MSASLRLVIVRHGKAEGHGEKPDRDRRLVGRGRKQAEWLREELRGGEWWPTAILASAFDRARETAEILRGEGGPRVEFRKELESELPVSGALALLEREAARFADGPVAVVGHNPQLSELLDVLVRGVGGRGGEDLRTGEAALVEFRRVAPASAHLIDRIRMADSP